MEHFVIIVNGWKLFFVSVSIFQQSLQKSQNMALSGCFQISTIRGRPRAAATSKMERFVIIVNGFQPRLQKDSNSNGEFHGNTGRGITGNRAIESRPHKT